MVMFHRNMFPEGISQTNLQNVRQSATVSTVLHLQDAVDAQTRIPRVTARDTAVRATCLADAQIPEMGQNNIR